MRPFGTTQQLARRRQRALDLLRQGQSPTQVAQRVGATAQSVRRWRRESQHPECKWRLSTPPGRPSRLSTTQLRRLVSALERGAYAYGYAEDYWTLDRIVHLIWDLFHVHYHPSGVWHVLQRVGWSCQKPQRRSLERDDKAIAHWKHYVWPHIKKVAGTGRHPDFT
jgi:transposase